MLRLADDGLAGFVPATPPIARHVIPVKLGIDKLAFRPFRHSGKRICDRFYRLFPTDTMGRFGKLIANAKIRANSDNENAAAVLSDSEVGGVQQLVIDKISG